MRFLVCMGMGGMWPNGVALMSEVWSGVSRPLLAGVIGTAANIGIFVVASIGKYVREVTIDDWRWVMLLGWSADRPWHFDPIHRAGVAALAGPENRGLGR